MWTGYILYGIYAGSTNKNTERITLGVYVPATF